jgi:hypothetical protein
MSQVQLEAFFLLQNACTAFPSTLVSMLELSPTLRRRTVRTKYYYCNYMCAHKRSVHCAGFTRHPGSFSEFSVGRHSRTRRQTEGHSCADISESVSVAPSSVTEAMYSALFCVLWLVWDTVWNKEFSFLIIMWKQTYINDAGENFALNFPKQHDLEIQFPN